MKFCTNCGHEVEDGKKFCPSCGQNLGSAAPSPSAPTSNQEPVPVFNGQAPAANTQAPGNNNQVSYNSEQAPYSSQALFNNGQGKYNSGQFPNNGTQVQYNNFQVRPAKVKTPMSKKTKIIILSVFILLAALAGFIGTGTYITGKSYALNKIEKAIMNKDSKELSKYLYSTDDSLKIDEEGAAALIKLLNQSPGYRTAFIQNLKKEDSFENFSMVKNMRTLLVFKSYSLEVPGQYITLSSNYKDVEFKLNNKSIGKEDKENTEKKFGPFLPGIYQLNFTLANEFGTSTIDKEVTLSGGKVKEAGSFNLTVVTPSFDIEGLKLVVDGKEKDTVLKKSGNKIGPFPKDSTSTIQFVKKYPWGELKTKEYKATDLQYGGYIGTFETGDTDLIKSMAPDIRDFMESYYAAKSALDSGKLVNASDEYKKSFKDSIYWYTAEQYTFQKAYTTSKGGSYTGATSDGKPLFYVPITSFYQYQADNRAEGLAVYVYYDETTSKWTVNSLSYNYYSGNGEVTADMIELK
ncbi:MAG: zinc-ribbon domain-containing protein [Bacillota bacterium]|nr:zinc-ribbon domain-containing protein [Bacillota bacterium]